MNSFKNPLMTTPYLLAIIATLTMLVSPLTTVVISVLIWLSGITLVWFPGVLETRITGLGPAARLLD